MKEVLGMNAAGKTMTAAKIREASALLLEDAEMRLGAIQKNLVNPDPKMQEALKRLREAAEKRKDAAFALQEFSFTFKGGNGS